MKTKLDKKVAELVRLKGLLVKYASVYYRSVESDGRIEMSSRMYSWIDAYNEMRGTGAWKVFCLDNFYDESHDAYDLFA